MKKEVQNEEKNVIYGLKKIPISQKRHKIANLFEEVSNDYDKMNDIMSLGAHRLWKKDLVEKINKEQFLDDTKDILDLAGGTGDIAFEIKKRFKNNNITIMDLTPSMIKIGKTKALAAGYKNNLKWLAGDSAYLPFRDFSFNNITCAFGIRNVAEIEKTIEGCYKVLKPGGKLMILEFSPEVIIPFQKFYEYYLKNIIPLLGAVIANNRKAYKYLSESIETFYSPNNFCTLLESKGFHKVDIKKYANGAACLFIASRI
jgi:demethylmenaquinone methyltransferase/2-methoxy-6-polyprenyl-1,4-benzoquinol methylase